ncbi:MAG: hypothetical protein IAE93_05725 [Ignavibacteria bacterium]|nr:hypothetical protein [Ignavibacteria bacterium]
MRTEIKYRLSKSPLLVFFTNNKRAAKAILMALMLLTFAGMAGLNSPQELNSTESIPEYKLADTLGCSYWINNHTGKRHNAKCKWYKNCRG